MDFNRSSPVLQASRPLGNPQLLNSSWLESSIKETLLPGKPWHKVLDRIGAVFADEVKQQLQEPKKRQMIFQFLGPQFVQKYFSEYPNQPSLLFSENISLTDYHQLEQSTLNMLQGQCSKAAQLVRFQLRQDGDFADLSPEMVDFVNDTCSLIEANMELLLATSEEQQKDEESAREQDSSAWFSSWALLARRRPHSIESQDIHLAIRRQTAIQSYAKGKDKPNQEPRARPLNCLGSDVLGESVCSIVLSNPEYLQTICDRLSGKLLPKRLRQLVWINKILKSDKRSHTKDSHKNIEKVAREKFGRTVQHRLAELKLRSGTRSPISGLIENAVVEKYENTPCMQPFATSEPMILETSKALNILYVYNGHYEPNFIHWLFPLQVALKRTPTAAEHPYEVAMYLNLLMQNLFPSWPEILAMAERVMSLLEREDPEFFTQLQSSFQKNVTYDPKDFLVELITLERKEAKNPYASSDALQHPPLLNKELLASPVIFLRKWMGEGFVSILDLPAILLIWDQMYMQNWNRKVMEDFCLAVLMLLKPSLMEAEDYSALRQVFLFHGYHLLTADIQRAWIHLQQGGLPADIPYFNRLRSPREEPPRHRVEKVPVAFREILPVGVKDVVLTLILPTLFVKLSLADMWLKDFDPLAVKLTVSVYFDQMKLRTKTSSAKPVLLQTTKGKVADIETSELSLQFTDVWTFDPLDPSEFTDAAESGADGIPFIVLRILYNRTENDSLTLGWVKVNAFQQDPAGVLGLWLPREYSLHLPVQPGTEPVNMIAPTTEQPTKESSYGPLHVKFTVYDPLKENIVESKILAPEQTTRDSGVPPHLREAWVPHSEATVLPQPTALDHAFDLYIDGLRYIPDSATIIKVTGKIVNSGLGDIPDLVAFPSLTSLARNPEFQYRAVLNTNDQKAMIASACLLLQVFTVVQYSGIITVLGNCGLHIFNDNGKLNVGGFQLRLRTETPPSLAPSEFSKYWSVPCCSILVRLLPHTQDPVPEPKYPTGFYFSDEAKPTKSELQIISSFQKDERFPRRVEDMTRRLMDRAQSRAESDQVESWYKERLDIQKFPVPKRLLTYIDLHHIVRYHQEAGVRARVTQAFGLQVEGLYVNAFARILKGRESMDLPELPQGWGGEEKFLMRQHDYASLQTSPRWTDPSVAMHPYLDAHSVLLVQLFGMDAIYKPDPTGQRPGVVAPRAGQNLQLYSQSQLGWTAVPLFQGQYVKSGIHSAPLFQGVPNTDFLEAVNSRPLMDVITDGIKKKTLNLLKTDGSITVEVWDSHYFDDEHYILEDIHDLLAAGKVSKFLGTQSKKKGNELSQLVLQTMDKKLQKLKRNSPEYQQEERFFEEAMTSAFYHLIETALLNSGYSPL